ncbi:hypothetical protein AAFP35_14920 [Gordonia sp. CPCC 206044]|uniref:hypothetical protein n=1 Tax=Gordonia sp. CPCC 206044 TaxID=3140793 RepID=UPI003AF3E06C
MAPRTHQLVQQIAAPDWVDQDLLTREDAVKLLDREIAAERDRLGEERITGWSTANRNAARDLAARRIAAMEALRTDLLSD